MPITKEEIETLPMTVNLLFVVHWPPLVGHMQIWRSNRAGSTCISNREHFAGNFDPGFRNRWQDTLIVTQSQIVGIGEKARNHSQAIVSVAADILTGTTYLVVRSLEFEGWALESSAVLQPLS